MARLMIITIRPLFFSPKGKLLVLNFSFLPFLSIFHLPIDPRDHNIMSHPPK
ncbi:hypothetical protein I33_3768 [Bacillus subtilis subsp. subtilis str. RO-NN-1]|nr:hypothetical protein I33_3768 [Bacillus subtilis subsp. subtilis str. RO-NN-1]